MKRWILAILLALMALISTTAPSSATVLTFDEFSTTGDNQIPVPDKYGGLTWENIWITDGKGWEGSGYYYGSTSGSTVAFNADGVRGGVTGGSFDFTGTYLTGAWRNGLNIQVQGYRGDILAYDSTVVVDINAPTFFRFDYAGVDRLVFDSFGGIPVYPPYAEGYQFAMDDFTFNESGPIPEPSTILLLGAGLMTVACIGKRMGDVHQR